MAFNDDFNTALAGLRAVQWKQIREKLEKEVSPLASERDPADVYDVIAELRSVTAELWDKGRLSLAPAPVKRAVFSALTKLLEGSAQYQQGGITLQDLENRADALHVTLWQYSLYDRTEVLPGLDAKNDRLEFLKRKGRRIIRELEKGLAKRDAVVRAETDAQALVKSTQALLEEIRRVASEATTASNETATKLGSATTTATTIERVSAEVEASRQRVKAASDESEATKSKILAFFREVEVQEKRLHDAVTTASATVDEMTNRITEHDQSLAALEQQVTSQLQKATGASLFHAFHERKKSITAAKWIWACASAASLLFTVWWGVYLADSAGEVADQLFWVKLSATVPLLALVVFSLAQYGRERRTEEEYAFKSALSLSLVPYKDLIESIHDRGRDAAYAQFLVATVGQIYAPPGITDERLSREDAIPLAGVQQLTKLIEKIVDR